MAAAAEKQINNREMTLLSILFITTFLNNASHKAEIRACDSTLKCFVMCLKRKLKLQAKRAGALCKLKSRDVQESITGNLRTVQSAASMGSEPGLLNSQIIDTSKQ